MATKSKKFKHTLFSKALCLLLSALMFFSAALCAATFLQAVLIFGIEEYLTDSIPDFYNTLAFRDEFASDVYKITHIADSNLSDTGEIISSQAEKTVNEVVEKYLCKKADIIKAELEYAVENYDDSYFNYEYSAELVTVPETETTNTESETELNIPKNIEAAKKILAAADGKDFLNYESLVRSAAFDYMFSYSSDVIYTTDSAQFTVNFSVDNLKYSQAQITSEFYAQFNNAKETFINDLTYNTYDYVYELEDLENFKYYAEDSQGKIYTNINSDFDIDSLTNSDIYAYSDGKNIVINGFKNYKNTTDRLKSSLSLSNGKYVYVYAEDIINNDIQKDIYSSMYNSYYYLKDIPVTFLISSFIICLVLAVAFLVNSTCTCGHKNSCNHPVISLIDKVPTDIHFIVSIGLITLGIFGIIIIIINFVFDASDPYEYIELTKYSVCTIAVACWLVFAEWLLSTARIKKCGYSFFKQTFIGKFLNWNYRGLKKLKYKLSNVFLYKPKILTTKAIIIITGYIAINIALILFAVGSWYFVNGSEIVLLTIIAMLIFNGITAYFAVKYITMLDKIITASCQHKNVDFGTEKAPDSLTILANNLTNTNTELEKAIAKAVKDEQMKTELITNVSHDLKTPLTSLITYSDLLSKCEITDDAAIKYTDVIHQQSIKLKRLIEDLIEASKVSTGNINLNMSILNLSELAIQAIVEYAPETDKNGNEIVFNEPDKEPRVIADSAKTYRIISNLLNNAKKYSARNTRIYVSVYTDEVNGYFEVKNISSEPLNISPEELTERFVRGDKSRSKEGNGLGLAIAKDLCILQNGELKLIIDGDLFKAIVKLPCKKEEFETETDTQSE